MTGGLDLSLDPHDPAQRPGRLGVGVVSAGRVGAVLGSALRAASAGHPEAAAAADELLAALAATPEAGERLAAFDRRLAADLAADLNRLKAVSRPAPITPSASKPCRV